MQRDKPLEKQDHMKMRPALKAAMFANREIPNFVTRAAKQLHKKLEVSRSNHFIRKVITVGIGERQADGSF